MLRLNIEVITKQRKTKVSVPNISRLHTMNYSLAVIHYTMQTHSTS